MSPGVPSTVKSTSKKSENTSSGGVGPHPSSGVSTNPRLPSANSIGTTSENNDRGSWTSPVPADASRPGDTSAATRATAIRSAAAATAPVRGRVRVVDPSSSSRLPGRTLDAGAPPMP